MINWRSSAWVLPSPRLRTQRRRGRRRHSRGIAPHLVGALGAPGLDSGEGKAGEVGAASLHGTPTSLGWVESAVWVNLALEPGEKRRPAVGGRLARVALGVQGMSSEAGAEGPLAGAQVVNGQR